MFPAYAPMGPAVLGQLEVRANWVSLLVNDYVYAVLKAEQLPRWLVVHERWRSYSR